MVNREDLKQIVMLTYLTDPMLDKLAQVIDVLEFDNGEIIFKENDPCERFYMVKSGNVVLEQKISDQVTALIGTIKPGFSFGWSVMIEDGFYTVDAVCREPSVIYSFKRNKIQELFAQDPEMGVRMYKRVLVIVKKRLDYRTEQFRQAIKNHPELQNLFRG